MKVRLLLTVAVASWVPAVALADFDGHPLDGHAQALSGFTGSQDFVRTEGSKTLDVTVDYAVFAPGSFPGTFVPFSGFPSLPAGDYVYAYELYTNSPSNPVPASSLVTKVADQISSLGQDDVLNPGGVSPSLAVAAPDGAFFYFLSDPLDPGEYSTVLLLSSANAPQFNVTTVANGGLSHEGLLPSPVPAPAAALLGTIGLALVARLRRRLG